ncbi:hypothetical protein ACS0TY_020354 [Phlomoides rotata]
MLTSPSKILTESASSTAITSLFSGTEATKLDRCRSPPDGSDLIGADDFADGGVENDGLVVSEDEEVAVGRRLMKG